MSDRTDLQKLRGPGPGTVQVSQTRKKMGHLMTAA